MTKEQILRQAVITALWLTGGFALGNLIGTLIIIFYLET